MQPFTTVASIAAPFREANLDTDRILPSRFMQKPRALGFARYLLHDQRFDHHGAERPNFVLNQNAYRDAKIFIAGANFGCGSSREQAVYAIADYGVRAIIAPSFGDIFFGNALKNGLLPIALSAKAVDRLLARCESEPTSVSVALAAQTVSCDGDSPLHFEIDEFHKTMLLRGEDEIGYTLGFSNEIGAFERRRKETSAWL